MWSWIVGGIGKWIAGGLIVTLVVTGAIIWHERNFVSRAEVQYWQQYAKDLTAAVEKKERLLRSYEKSKIADEDKIEELEDERERLLEEDRQGDDPVVLSPGDAERLRTFRP